MGLADYVFVPHDLADLKTFLQGYRHDFPLHIIGATSNSLIRDGGLRGVTIKLGKAFCNITQPIASKPYLEVGAFALDRNLALYAAQKAIGGFEFLIGIPGSLGGAVAMNAGAHDAQMQDRLIWIGCMDRFGTYHKIKKEDLTWKYRQCELDPNWIIVQIGVQGYWENGQVIGEKMRSFEEMRAKSQPISGHSAGCAFKNPWPHRAWELIDQARCRGMQHNGAQISPIHCNFIVNTHQALAKDIEELGEIVRKKVLEHSNIQLEWEIRRLGDFKKVL
jgi:UDP-N-acetylmuramate dehydrogenase